jgi:colicin import membrane protein
VNIGLAVSFLLHASLLAWAVLTIRATPPLKLPEPIPVEVAIISADELVRLRQGNRDSKNLDAEGQEGAGKQPPKKEPPKTAAPPPAPPPPPPPQAETTKPQEDEIAKKLAALPPPAKKEPPPEPALTPGPTPEDQKKLADKVEEERKRAEAEAKAKADAEAKRKAAEEKKKRDEQLKKLAEQKKKREEEQKKRVASLEDRLKNLPDDSTPKALVSQQVKAAAPAGAKSDVPTKSKGPVAGAPEGKDKQLTASQASMLGTLMKQQVSRCWNINSGLEGIDKIVVQVEVKLKQDGTLAQPPKVVAAQNTPIFKDAADSAVRALVKCEPYELPADLYQGGWDYMVVTFDPKRMF